MDVFRSRSSLTDEPIFWADLLAKGGHTQVGGVLIEQSLVGETYLRNFRSACRRKNIRIVAEASLAQTAQDVTEAVRTMHEAKPDALVHCGFGFGIVFLNTALESLGWDPPRFTSTAFQNAWMNPVMWNAFMGWTGVDQYDEGNPPVGQQFLDKYEAKFGRRPQYCVPVVNCDVASALLRACTDAHPLSPRGIKEALERVKMMPAASGGARHAGVVRQLDPSRVDGRRLSGGQAARRGRGQLAPRRPVRRGVSRWRPKKRPPHPPNMPPNRRRDHGGPRCGSPSPSSCSS